MYQDSFSMNSYYLNPKNDKRKKSRGDLQNERPVIKRYYDTAPGI